MKTVWLAGANIALHNCSVYTVGGSLLLFCIAEFGDVEVIPRAIRSTIMGAADVAEIFANIVGCNCLCDCVRFNLFMIVLGRV